MSDLKESCFQDCWKVSSVVPAFKNVGEISMAKSYHLLVFFLWLHSFLPPLKLGGRVLIIKTWTNRGFMKKVFRNRGLVDGVGWGGGVLLDRGFPNCFISFSSEKHVFITIGILFFLFLSGKYSCLLYSIDLFFHVVYFLLENDIL